MATHRVDARPDTVRWGLFSAAHEPILTVESGDTVVMQCVSGPREVMPPPGSGMETPAALAEIHAKVPQLGPHIITGPIGVRGAEPGDMLEVRIDAIEFGADWG